MEAAEIKKIIEGSVTINIKYNGEWGGVDPYYEKKQETPMNVFIKGLTRLYIVLMTQ